MSAVVAGKWAAAASPFAPWRTAYLLRLSAAAASTALVAAFPASSTGFSEHPTAFVALAAVGLGTSFASTLMFTALGSFYNRVSDARMGGAYLTMLNTIANLGITLPKIAVFSLMDLLSFSACMCAPLPLGFAVVHLCCSFVLILSHSCLVPRDGARCSRLHVRLSPRRDSVCGCYVCFSPMDLLSFAACMCAPLLSGFVFLVCF